MALVTPAFPARSGRTKQGLRAARNITAKQDQARELTDRPHIDRRVIGFRVPTAPRAAYGLGDNHPTLPRTSRCRLSASLVSLVAGHPQKERWEAP